MSRYAITPDGVSALEVFDDPTVRFAASLDNGQGFVAFDGDLADLYRIGSLTGGRMLSVFGNYKLETSTLTGHEPLATAESESEGSDEPPLATVVDELQFKLNEALDVIAELVEFSDAFSMEVSEDENEAVSRALRVLGQDQRPDT